MSRQELNKEALLSIISTVVKELNGVAESIPGKGLGPDQFSELVAWSANVKQTAKVLLNLIETKLDCDQNKYVIRVNIFGSTWSTEGEFDEESLKRLESKLEALALPFDVEEV